MIKGVISDLDGLAFLINGQGHMLSYRNVNISDTWGTRLELSSLLIWALGVEVVVVRLLIGLD